MIAAGWVRMLEIASRFGVTVDDWSPLGKDTGYFQISENSDISMKI
jgi:S-ribosylhomocysteine lyase LuxS involved in autoinducer biosynthesis